MCTLMIHILHIDQRREEVDVGRDEPELQRPSASSHITVALPSIVTSEKRKGCVVDYFWERHALKNYICTNNKHRFSNQWGIILSPAAYTKNIYSNLYISPPLP